MAWQAFLGAERDEFTNVHIAFRFCDDGFGQAFGVDRFGTPGSYVYISASKPSIIRSGLAPPIPRKIPAHPRIVRGQIPTSTIEVAIHVVVVYAAFSAVVGDEASLAICDGVSTDFFGGHFFAVEIDGCTTAGEGVVSNDACGAVSNHDAIPWTCEQIALDEDIRCIK